MPERLVSLDQSLIVAADIHPNQLQPLIEAVRGIEGIEGIKFGARLSSYYTMREVSGLIHENGLVAVYDQQKAGTDVPDVADDFASMCEEGHVDYAILFPHSGPRTQRAFTEKLQNKSTVEVILGAHMTHPEFLAPEGYISPKAPERAYRLGAQMGVRNFVLPGNNPEAIRKYRQAILEETGGEQVRIWAPGLVTQGGKISDLAQEAGPYWHAIIGRGITADPNKYRENALQMVSQLR